MKRPRIALTRAGWRRIHSVAAPGLTLLLASSAAAQERLCDNAFEDCRTPIIDSIRAERVGIDVSFWFMTDWRYSSEIIRRWQDGVPVRILLDLRSDANYPAGATIRLYAPGTQQLLWHEQVAVYCFQAANSYYGRATTERHFGLGARAAVDVEVRFHPSGVVRRVNGVPAGTTVTIDEGLLFADGFETGTTERWSASQP